MMGNGRENIRGRSISGNHKVKTKISHGGCFSFLKLLLSMVLSLKFQAKLCDQITLSGTYKCTYHLVKQQFSNS